MKEEKKKKCKKLATDMTMLILATEFRSVESDGTKYASESILFRCINDLLKLQRLMQRKNMISNSHFVSFMFARQEKTMNYYTSIENKIKRRTELKVQKASHQNDVDI